MTLQSAQIPAHTHQVAADNAPAAGVPSPANNFLAAASSGGRPMNAYAGPTSPAPLNGASLSSTGNGIPHENRQPLLAMNYIISLFGIYPSQT